MLRLGRTGNAKADHCRCVRIVPLHRTFNRNSKNPSHHRPCSAMVRPWERSPNRKRFLRFPFPALLSHPTGHHCPKRSNKILDWEQLRAVGPSVPLRFHVESVGTPGSNRAIKSRIQRNFDRFARHLFPTSVARLHRLYDSKSAAIFSKQKGNADQCGSRPLLGPHCRMHQVKIFKIACVCRRFALTFCIRWRS